MITLKVKITDHGVREKLAGFQQALADKEVLHTAMAAGVETSVRAHLRSINSRSPNSDYYSKAARSVEVEADASHALVRVPRTGMALHYYGGQVLPGKSISSFTGKPTVALAIPTDNVPRQGEENERASPREMGILAFILAFIPARNRPGSVGYLVEGEEKQITRGPRKGGRRIVPKKGGQLLFVLRSWTDHDPDESVLPSLIALQTAARDGADKHINSYTNLP